MKIIGNVFKIKVTFYKFRSHIINELKITAANNFKSFWSRDTSLLMVGRSSQDASQLKAILSKEAATGDVLLKKGALRNFATFTGKH